jgi:chromosome segregation ATPase
MRVPRVILVVAVLAVVGYVVAKAFAPGGELHNKGEGKKPSPAPAPAREWSTDEMAKDPEGYLKWADQQIQAQVRQRDELLGKLEERRREIKNRQVEVGAELKEFENFKERLATAVRRAEDEDRWPVVVGANRFDRAKAKALLDDLGRQIEQRRPLAQDYEAAIAKMDGRATSLRGDLTALNQLREKIALDLERVRLNQGVAELEKLSRTADEIAHFSKILGQMGDAAAKEPEDPKTGGLKTLDSMLK